MMRGIDQLMRFLQFQDTRHVSREYQPVAAENEFVLTHRRDDLMIKADNLDDMASLHIVKPGFLHRQDKHVNALRRHSCRSTGPAYKLLHERNRTEVVLKD